MAPTIKQALKEGFMKKILLALTVILGLQTAWAVDGVTQKMKISWKKQKDEQSVVVMCDDTYVSKLEVIVLGAFEEDFDVNLGDGISGVPKVKVYQTPHGPETKMLFKLNGDSGLLELEHRSGRTVLIDITDGC